MKPSQARIIACPTCKGPSRYAPDNRFRPFCSERCRTHDLGAWASENYRVPTNPSPGDDEAGNDERQSH